MSQKRYVRIRVKFDAATRTVWAVKMGANGYLVSDKYGDTETDAGRDAKGTPIERKEIIVTNPQDIIWEKPAHMSRKYAELEVSE